MGGNDFFQRLFFFVEGIVCCRHLFEVTFIQELKNIFTDKNALANLTWVLEVIQKVIGWISPEKQK